MSTNNKINTINVKLDLLLERAQSKLDALDKYVSNVSSGVRGESCYDEKDAIDKLNFTVDAIKDLQSNKEVVQSGLIIILIKNLGAVEFLMRDI